MITITGSYPADWHDIAERLKKAAAWKCERCHRGHSVKAARVITVHHLDGNKANCEDYNLAVLCQRCHLSVQNTFDPRQMTFLPPPTWLLPHIAASPWKCTP